MPALNAAHHPISYARTSSSIDKIHAELAWVNEPVDRGDRRSEGRFYNRPPLVLSFQFGYKYNSMS